MPRESIEMAMKSKPSKNQAIETHDFDLERFVKDVPLLLDMPGIFYVEARKRIRTASRNLESLNLQLDQHQKRVLATASKNQSGHPDDPWTDVIHGVSGLETLFGKTIRDFAIADVLLVAAAESYINAIAEHVLPTADAAIFEKLTPTGKWLFLPKIMGLKWQPNTAKGDLQEFVAVVARRNRVVHPKKIGVKGTASVHDFVDRLRLDKDQSERGIRAVKGLIASISLSWRGSYGPDWLQESKANNHPPCFLMGGSSGYARLGRGGKKPSGGT